MWDGLVGSMRETWVATWLVGYVREPRQRRIDRYRGDVSARPHCDIGTLAAHQ
jgi:hypothetical protein